MKKLLLSLQSYSPQIREYFGLPNFLLLSFLLVSSLATAQFGPGSPYVDAGQDVTLDCGETCTELTADFLHTGQTSQYEVHSIPYAPPFPFTGGTPVSANTDDVWSPLINMPFDFCFFGQNYNKMIIGSNAVISFETNINGQTAGGRCEWSFGARDAIPSPTLFKTTIFGPYMDTNPAVAGSGTINWYVTGTAPNRAMVVNFPNIKYFGSACSHLSLTSQVIIYETTNAIEVYVQNRPSGCSWQNGVAVLGIQNQTGTQGYVAPGRNTGDWSASNEAWRFMPSGDSNVTFEWLDANGTVIGTDPTITVCPDEDAATYTAKAVWNNCNGSQVTVTDDVTVFKAADAFDVDLGGDQELCGVTSYDLTATIINGDPTNATYLWSTGETTPTITVTTSGTYSVEVSIDTCTITEAVDIHFNDSPLVDLGDDFNSCFVDPVVLDASPSNYNDPSALTYEWRKDGSILAGETAPTLSVTEPGLYAVKVTVLDCEVTDEVNIELGEIEVDLGEDITSCIVDPIILDASPTNYNDPLSFTYEWRKDGNVLTGETNPTLSVTDTGVYSVTVSNAAGCTATDEITIEDGPLVVDLGADIISCLGDPIILDATPSNGAGIATYEWTKDGVVIPGATDATLSVTEAGVYGVTVTAGACVGSDEITITTDSISVDLGDDFETCFSEITTLDANADGTFPSTTTYEWTLNGTVIAGADESTLEITEAGTYGVTVNAGGCIATDTVVVSLGTISVDLGDDFETCFDTPVILNANPDNNLPPSTTYVWSHNGNVIPGEDQATLTINDSGTYSVTASDGACTASDSINILPGDELIVSIGGDTLLCPDQKYTITATTDEQGVTYQWFENGVEIPGATGQTYEASVSAGNMSTTFSVVISSGGCTGTDSMEVRLYPVGNCTISQGISPNGDGFNDSLDLTFLNDRTGIKKLQIFNRLGTMVFEQVNYTNQWVGQSKDGKELPTGTYFYVIDLNGEDSVYGQQTTGWIYLNRKP